MYSHRIPIRIQGSGLPAEAHEKDICSQDNNLFVRTQMGGSRIQVSRWRCLRCVENPSRSFCRGVTIVEKRMVWIRVRTSEGRRTESIRKMFLDTVMLQSKMSIR